MHDLAAHPHWCCGLDRTLLACCTLLLLLLYCWLLLRLTRTGAPSVRELPSFEPFSLFDLQGEIQSSDGEVNSLWEHSSDLGQEIQDEFPLGPDQAGEKLRYPGKPLDGRHPRHVFVHCLRQLQSFIVISEQPEDFS